jgi:uncharacterized membrane protein
MSRTHPHSFGLVLSIFLAVWHSLWALLVWLGAAQTLVDFVFRLHMITPPYRIAAFNLGTAATLVLVTAGIGYVMGFVVGFIWNRFGPRAA